MSLCSNGSDDSGCSTNSGNENCVPSTKTKKLENGDHIGISPHRLSKCINKYKFCGPHVDCITYHYFLYFHLCNFHVTTFFS